jgi:hypothetical protein
MTTNSYIVQSVDADNNTMVIEFIQDSVTITLNVPLPADGQTCEDVIYGMWDNVFPPSNAAAVAEATSLIGQTIPVPERGPDPDEIFNDKITAGIIITSNTNQLQQSTFALDDATQSDLSGVAATVGLLDAFPDQSTSGWQYPDINGTPVAFPTIKSFKDVYAAYAALIQQLNEQYAILSAGGSPNWPSQSVNIA